MSSFFTHVGFKKEHIRIQINDYGRLKISGQRPVADNRWSRFLKELQVPDYCNVSEIKAKFEDGLLYIIKPILVTKPGTDGKAPETALDGKATTEKKGDDDSKNGVSQKTKPKREESDGGVNEQSNEKKEALDAGKDVQKVSEKERDRIEGPKYSGKVAAKHEQGRNGARMSESRKEEAVTPAELTSPGRGNMMRNLTIVRGFYTRKRLMLNAALAAIVITAGVVFYLTR